MHNLPHFRNLREFIDSCICILYQAPPHCLPTASIATELTHYCQGRKLPTLVTHICGYHSIDQLKFLQLACDIFRLFGPAEFYANMTGKCLLFQLNPFAAMLQIDLSHFSNARRRACCLFNQIGRHGCGLGIEEDICLVGIEFSVKYCQMVRDIGRNPF